MNNVRSQVQDFMRSCERLFGFAHQNGGLTAEECEALSYYAKELQQQIVPFCSNAEDPYTARR